MIYNKVENTPVLLLFRPVAAAVSAPLLLFLCRCPHDFSCLCGVRDSSGPAQVLIPAFPDLLPDSGKHCNIYSADLWKHI